MMDLSQRDLIGKFEYINMSRGDILSWVWRKWKPFIENMPKVFMLVNGWVFFQFLLEEDRRIIEGIF